MDTIYSNICDLNQGILYINFFHDYDKTIEIRFPEIFELGYHSYDLATLFAGNSTHSPNKPNTLTGTVSGSINNEYVYSSVGTDDDGDLLYYFFDWGDGTDSGWIGYYGSGDECSASHVWLEEGNFEIKVKTRDLFGFESEWSDPLIVTMPKRKSQLFLELIKNNNPLLFSFLSFFLQGR
jgi:hypothetical protein